MAGLHCFYFFIFLRNDVMKKAMLFLVALLFSFGANAASLNLHTVSSSGATQSVDVASGQTVLGSGTVATAGSWYSLFDVDTTADTTAIFSWTFNPENLASGQVKFGEVSCYGCGYVSSVVYNITSSFTFSAFLEAGKIYGIDLINATSTVMKYDLSVQAVPVPAAAFLFAPALLGLFGLRRKSQAVAA
jgi:hypothetical protein